MFANTVELRSPQVCSAITQVWLILFISMTHVLEARHAIKTSIPATKDWLTSSFGELKVGLVSS